MPPVMPERPPQSWPDGTGADPCRPAPSGDDRQGPELNGDGRRFSGPTLVLCVLAAAVLLAAAATWSFGQGGTDEGPYRVLEANEYKSDITSCRVQPDGRPVAAGTIRNRTGHAQILVVEIGLLDPDDIVIDTPRATLVDVAADAEAPWQVASPYRIPRLTPLACVVRDVFATPAE